MTSYFESFFSLQFLLTLSSLFFFFIFFRLLAFRFIIYSQYTVFHFFPVLFLYPLPLPYSFHVGLFSISPRHSLLSSLPSMAPSSITLFPALFITLLPPSFHNPSLLFFLLHNPSITLSLSLSLSLSLLLFHVSISNPLSPASLHQPYPPAAESIVQGVSKLLPLGSPQRGGAGALPSFSYFGVYTGNTGRVSYLVFSIPVLDSHRDPGFIY